MEGIMTMEEAGEILLERHLLNEQIVPTYEPRYEPRFENDILVDRLLRYGFTYKEMIGDGNCVVRSVADQIWGNQNRHNIVRRTGAARMLDFRGDYIAEYYQNPIRGLTYDEYVSVVALPYENVHPIFTQAICDAYAVRIIELVSNDDYCVAEFTPKDREVTATIGLVSSSGHTDSMYPHWMV